MAEWKPMQIVEKISTLPTLPTTVSAILKEMANPDSSAIGLAKLISSDQSLAGGILRVVNSAYYNFPRKIGSLTDAIVLLGYKGVRSIVLSVTAFRFFSNSFDYLDRKKLWNHALACAIISDLLNRKLKVAENNAFEAGLLHDIGKVVFDYLDPELFRGAIKEAKRKELPLISVEPSHFGTDHSEVGSLLANHWNLPENIVQAIRFHHHPEKSTPEFLPVTCLVALSNAITYALEMGDSVSETMPELPPIVFETLKIEETFIEESHEEVSQRVETGLEAFASIS
ncbi:MAG: HDOD domain-containing protein [Candidatus Hydrogenedens sp.]